jgi:hypothetical protein
MTDDTPLAFDLPAVRCTKLTVDFEGGTQSSNTTVIGAAFATRCSSWSWPAHRASPAGTRTAVPDVIRDRERLRHDPHPRFRDRLGFR